MKSVFLHAKTYSYILPRKFIAIGQNRLEESATHLLALPQKNEGGIYLADFNKRKREDKNTDKEVGSGVGVVPGDTIASALDPFGGAAGAVGEEVVKRNKRSTTEDNQDSNSEV